jgi:hypothetical protein
LPDVGWIVFLIAAWYVGHCLVLILGGGDLRWLAFTAQGGIQRTRLPSGGLRGLYRLAASLVTGVMIETMLLYAVYYLLNRFYGENALGLSNIHAANLIVIPLSMLGAALLLRRKKSRAETRFGHQHPRWIRSVQNRSLWPLLVFLVILLFYSIWLFYSSYWEKDGVISAGATVFSDLGPHSAMMASFSRGSNAPTEYAHFAGDNILYHFFFYFFAGNLQALGLSFVHALNLPSILFFLTFLLLFGLFCYRITGLSATVILGPLLVLFRSSFAFFSELGRLAAEFGFLTGGFFNALLRPMKFIGPTLRDDWGLWTINVYANQRHFSFGLSVFFLILLLVLPDIERGIGALPVAREGKIKAFLDQFRTKWIWISGQPADFKRQLLVLILLVLLPYWHGSILVAALLLLAVFALFSASRIVYVAYGLFSFVAVLLTKAFFAPGSSVVSFFSFHFGFLAEKKTLFGVLVYLLLVTGIQPLLSAVVFVFARFRTKLLIAAFSLPLIVAFLLKLTPDITVNHKFIEISRILLAVFAAEALVRLWKSRKYVSAARLLAVVLALFLTVTGVYEHLIYRNINRAIVLTAEPDNEVNTFILEATDPAARFIVPPYSFASFPYTGRRMWNGHAYYAWSAGHDTFARDAKMKDFFVGKGDITPAAYAKVHGISYFLVDDSLRAHSDYDLDEDYFRAHFPVLKAFPDSARTVIYDLREGEIE